MRARRARGDRGDPRARALPILAGGTGLYIRAVLHGLIDGVEADAELREQLEAEQARAEREGDPDRLHRRLARERPRARRRGSIRTTAAHRARARDRGRDGPADQPRCAARTASRTRPYRVLHLALAPERKELYARIDRRCQAMIDAGLLQEVRELAAAGYGPELRPMRAIGYRHIVPVMQGSDTLAQRARGDAPRHAPLRAPPAHLAAPRARRHLGGPGATRAAIADLVDAFLAADGVRARSPRRPERRPMSSAALPIVAIVGRPNVGKSTLFNRFAGHRRALVEDRPGITRDRIVEEVEVEGRRVLVVDTAGLDDEAEAGLPAAVQAQAWSAIRDADAILWVADAQSGVLPDDVELARTLRKTAKPVTLAVNKVDVPAHARSRGRVPRARLRAHARDLRRARAAAPGTRSRSSSRCCRPPRESEAERAPGIRIAVVGRPNVGKSSLVNRLLGEERVVVSDEPGTTRDAIDVALERDGERYTLVDTAGLRRPGRRSEATEHVSALMTVRALERADVALLLVDAERGLHRSGRAGRAAHARPRRRRRSCSRTSGTACAARSAREEVRADIAHGLRFMADAPVLAVSAKTGAGLDGAVRARARAARDGAARDPDRRAQPLAPGRGAPPRARDGAARVAQAPAQVLLRHADRRAAAHVHAVLQRARGRAAGLSALPREPPARGVRLRGHAGADPAARALRTRGRALSAPSRAIQSAPAHDSDGGRMARRDDGTAAEMLGELESVADRLGEWLQTHLDGGGDRDRARCSLVAGLGAWLVVGARERGAGGVDRPRQDARRLSLGDGRRARLRSRFPSSPIPAAAAQIRDRVRAALRRGRGASTRARSPARSRGSSAQRSWPRREPRRRGDRPARAGGRRSAGQQPRARDRAPAARAAARSGGALGRCGRAPRGRLADCRLPAARLGDRRRRALPRDGGRADAARALYDRLDREAPDLPLDDGQQAQRLELRAAAQ